MKTILIFFVILFIIENAYFAFFLFLTYKERRELTRMLASRTYGEYAANDPDQKSAARPNNHRNMITKQQENMTPKRE